MFNCYDSMVSDLASIAFSNNLLKSVHISIYFIHIAMSNPGWVSKTNANLQTMGGDMPVLESL